MVHVRLAAFLCLFAIISFSEESEHPSNLIPKCKLTDSHFLQCLKQGIEILKPSLAWGIPQLNIPSLEPVTVPPFTITRNVSSVATYHLFVRDFFYSGASNFEILNYHVDPDALTLRIKIGVPQLDFNGVNSGAGNVYGVPFHGTGRLHGTITNLVVDILLTGGKYNRDGKFYIQWKTVATDVQYKNFFISVKDFFPEPVSSTISQRIGANHDLFESHVTPLLQYSLEPYIVNILNNVHAIYPFDVLYPKV